MGRDLQPDRSEIPNVIGALSKPFTSDSLITAVREYLQSEGRPGRRPSRRSRGPGGRFVRQENGCGRKETFAEPVLHPPVAAPGPIRGVEKSTPQRRRGAGASRARLEADRRRPIRRLQRSRRERPAVAPVPRQRPNRLMPIDTGKAYFCGDSSFFSLHWALQTIAREKLTGTLRTFWSRESVELLAKDGQVMLVTTHDPALIVKKHRSRS